MSRLEASITITHDPIGCVTMISEIVTDGRSNRAELHFDDPTNALRTAALLFYHWADQLVCPSPAQEEA